MRLAPALSRLLLFLGLALAACDYTTPPDERKLRSIARMYIAPARNVAVRPGDTVSLRLVALDSSNRLIEGIAARWESGNAAVATVNQQGVVTAVSPGTARITATAGSHEAAFPLTIYERALGGFRVTIYPDTLVTVRSFTAVEDRGAEPLGDSRILRGSALKLRFDQLAFTGGPVTDLGEVTYSYKGLLPAGVVESQLQLVAVYGGSSLPLRGVWVDTIAQLVHARLPAPAPIDSALTIALYTPQGVAIFASLFVDQSSGAVAAAATTVSMPAITQAVAFLGPQRIDLTRTGGGGQFTSFSGSLAADAAPKGAPVIFSAMNAAGLTATATVPLPNRSPRISIYSPAPAEVTLDGSVHLKATCTDPDGDRCTIVITRLAVELARATDSLEVETFVPASGFLTFTASDSAGASGVGFREVIVFPSGALSLVGKLPGRVLDYDGSAVVHTVNPESFAGLRDREAALWYRGSLTGADQLLARARGFGSARIMEPGVVVYSVWVPKAVGGPDLWDLYEWRNGTTTLLDRATDHSNPIVEGSYLLWTRISGGDTLLVRRQVSTQAQSVITRGVPPWRGGFSVHYVAPNGEVSFINRNVQSGQGGLYVSDGANAMRLDAGLYSYSRTDGLSVVASRNAGFAPESVFMFTGLRRELLARSFVKPVNVLGMTAFSPTPVSPYELWMRAADGTLASTGFTSAELAIEYLTREGNSIIRSGSSYTLVSPAGVARAVPRGIFDQRNGGFYVLGGTSIIRIQ